MTKTAMMKITSSDIIRAIQYEQKLGKGIYLVGLARFCRPSQHFPVSSLVDWAVVASRHKESYTE